MKQGNNNRRGRGRGQRKPHGMGGSHSGGAGKGNQTYDSNGPDIRVRGNAHQVLEKYLQMARDAGVAGDRVAAENYLQHAEHYYRMIAAQTEGQRPRVGGRELSVADVNVQNVSQGLSAALYAAPASADGISGNGEQTGAAVNPNGDFADEDGDQFGNFNSQGFNGPNRRDHRNGRDQAPRNQNQANRDQDGRGQDQSLQDGRVNDGRSNDSRGDGRGPRRHQRGPGRDGQRYDGPRQEGQRADGLRADGQRQDGQRFGGGQQASFQDGNAGEAAPYQHAPESRPAERVVPDRAGGEQPEYPSELLAQPIVATPAVQLPEAQPSLALSPAEEAPAAAAEGEAAAPARRGRGRPKGSTTTTRRTRSAAASEGEAAAAAAPVEAGE